MTYKRVDIDEDACYEGWSYLNRDGDEETVSLSYCGQISFIDSNCNESCVYTEDIPKLIKALQAAYDYKE